MAKLRIFVSSTYYDLKHIRNYLEAFIDGFGYEPVLFESGDIPFEHDKPLDESCYKEILNSQMQILIIGGRYGSEESKPKVQPKAKKSSKKSEETADEKHRRYNSITKMEYETALSQNIPVFIFVEKQVLAEYDTYRKNRDNNSIEYAHVDSINVFRLIDDIYSQTVGNYVKGFEKFEDISNWLRDQWSGMFAEFLKRDNDRIEIESISAKIDELSAVSNALKEYSEALVKNSLAPEKSKALIEEEDRKIEHEKAVRFINESLIRDLRREFHFKIPPSALYKKFLKSEYFDEFLHELNVLYVAQERFAAYSMFEEESSTLTTKDIYEHRFKELKIKYQNKVLE